MKYERTKGMTVKQLLAECMIQVDKGNGNKEVLISSDDEGNEYHTLFFTFCDDKKQLNAAKGLGMFHDNQKAEEVILLG